MTTNAEVISLFDRAIVTRASLDAVTKLNPVTLMRNPVIFVTEIVAVMTTVVGIEDLFTHKAAAFPLVIAAWLWLTVLFATFAEAVAEGRGRARAESMKRARTDTMSKLILDPRERNIFQPVAAPDLRKGDLVLVEAGDIMPSDGEILVSGDRWPEGTRKK